LEARAIRGRILTVKRSREKSAGELCAFKQLREFKRLTRRKVRKERAMLRAEMRKWHNRWCDQVVNQCAWGRYQKPGTIMPPNRKVRMLGRGENKKPARWHRNP
jgi:hypothetical protein